MSSLVVLDTVAQVMALNGTGQAVVPVRLSYDSTDPFAVTVTFLPTPQTGAGRVVTWTFARDLLEDGLASSTGTGDVWVSPLGGESVVQLVLRSPEGAAVVLLDWDNVAAFIDRTLEIVPAGAEHVNWDGELAALLTAPDAGGEPN